MADEIRATYDTGFTLYVLVFNAAGQVWRNNAPQQFLAYAPGAIGVYDIPLSEIATNSGQYRADWPVDASMVEGTYSVVLFEQAGLGPVVADDERIGETGVMVWDGGSNEVDTFELMDRIQDTIMGPDADDLTGISGEIDAVPTANENRDAILDDATRFSGADMAELDFTNIPADIDTLLTRLTGARAGYLDELGPMPGAIPDDLRVIDTNVDTILDDTDTMEADLKSYMLTDIIGADSDTLESLSDQLDTVGTGSGATAETYTVTDSTTGLPIDGVRVWMTSDIAGTAEIGGSGHTNALGQVTLRHDVPTGTTIYVWRELAGYSFDDPDIEVAS